MVDWRVISNYDDNDDDDNDDEDDDDADESIFSCPRGMSNKQ